MDLVTEEGRQLLIVVERYRTKFPVYNREARAALIDLGRILRKIREEQFGTLTSMAATMGYGAQYLSDLENGNRHWTDRAIQAWDSALATRSAK